MNDKIRIAMLEDTIAMLENHLKVLKKIVDSGDAPSFGELSPSTDLVHDCYGRLVAAIESASNHGGQNAVKKWVEDGCKSENRPNLIRANLYGAALAGVNLSYANLYEADLRWANLSGADLRWANLEGAYLSRTILIGANLSEANLNGTILTEANLAGANLEGAYLSRTCLTETNLRGANLTGTIMKATNPNEAKWNKDTVWPEGYSPERTEGKNL